MFTPTKDFVALVADELGASRADAARATAAVQKALVFCAGSGGFVWRGFGTFKTTLRQSRKARNPRTGEVVMVPARETMTFKPSVLLRKD